MVTGAILTLGNKDSAKAISPSDTIIVESSSLLLIAKRAVASTLVLRSQSLTSAIAAITQKLQQICPKTHDSDGEVGLVKGKPQFHPGDNGAANRHILKQEKKEKNQPPIYYLIFKQVNSINIYNTGAYLVLNENLNITR